MMGLIQNEMIKIFEKRASWIYMAILVVAMVIGGFIYQRVNGEVDENWRENLEMQNAQYQHEITSTPADQDTTWLEDQIKQNERFLEKDINPTAKTNWHFMNDVVIGVTMLVTLFSVIVASAVVAAEFSDGTVKQLLIRPHKRWKILLSKYVAVLLYALLLMATLFVSGFIVGILFYGLGDFQAPFFEYTLEGQKEAILGTQFLLKTAYYLPSLLMITTISFMLSTLFKSQAVAVGIGIFVLFVSSTLGGLIIMLAEKYTWAKFLIFPHLDLTVFALQDKILQNITLAGSLSILAIYYIVFMIATFVYFQKRDVSI
ncbi:ABC transporter permease subunit [Robertmurraya korlensis]|uniref:ABC transporter permease subunit n=1 Tax=Robertmurraya korlensis TaxID=519977 RepID=UPI00082613C3|nr:ABC transporter permease subunit [Robertmurraya korlensis]